MQDNKQSLILKAAIQRFALFGYKRTVIDDLVRDLSIAKGSFYLYFKSKEELFTRAINSERLAMQAEVEKAVAKAHSSTGRVQILLHEMLEGMEAHPLLARYMSSDPEMQLPPKLAHPHALEDSGKDACALMAKHWMIPIIQGGIDRGEFRHDLNPSAAVSLIISFVHIQLHNKRAPFIEGDIKAFLDEQMKIFFGGILAPVYLEKSDWVLHEGGKSE
jgi:AcrR family transcriptional regulator